jgi:hypothetical protein
LADKGIGLEFGERSQIDPPGLLISARFPARLLGIFKGGSTKLSQSVPFCETIPSEAYSEAFPPKMMFAKGVQKLKD